MGPDLVSFGSRGWSSSAPDNDSLNQHDQENRQQNIEMNVTPEEIEAAKTPAGGWTREQLAKWGVPWPPPKGWRKQLTTKPTSQDRAR